MNCQCASSFLNLREAAQLIAKPDDPSSILIDCSFMMDKPQSHTGSLQPEFYDWFCSGNDEGGGTHDPGRLWFDGTRTQEDAAAPPSNNFLTPFHHPEAFLEIGGWIQFEPSFGPDTIRFQDHTFHPVVSQSIENMPIELPNHFSPSPAESVGASPAHTTAQQTIDSHPLSEQSQSFTLQECEISQYERCMAAFGLQGRSFSHTQAGPNTGRSVTQDDFTLPSTYQRSQGRRSVSSTSQYVPSVCSSASSPPSSPGTSQRLFDFIQEDPSSTPIQ